MIEEFKIGDKVTCRKHGKGEVIGTYIIGNYPIEVTFTNGDRCTYTKDAKEYKSDDAISLYHGHGVLKMVLIPEPEYEWQWLYKYHNDERCYITKFYKNTEDVLKNNSTKAFVVSRIEESKREIKND